MDLYYYIALAAIFTQLVFLVQMYRNYHYVLSKYHKKRTKFKPKTALIIPCKGLDAKFENNITSFFNLDYEDYLLWFVVDNEDDPAYAKLCQLKNKLSAHSKAGDIRVLLAGQATSCSQKVHNLLYAYRLLPDDVEVMAFADSDICVRRDWLSHLLYPLRKETNGAASGYRWFIPQRNNLPTLVLSAVNAKIAQLLGSYSYVQAWGGSMAIRVDVFRRVGLHEMWQKAVSDDLSLSYAVKKAGLRIIFVPACLVGSYVKTTWSELFEFGRRQFLITRITAPETWWFGLISSIYSILGLWAGAVIAVYAVAIGNPNRQLFIAVPVLFFAGHLWRSTLRQRMIAKLLKDDLPRMRFAMAADILGSWLYSPLLFFFILSSAIGRTISWRGIKYKLLGPTETIVEGTQS